MSSAAPAPVASAAPPDRGRQRIVLENVFKSFERAGQKTQVLADISLSADDGTFISLLGPSGCGKTTLLRLADGLIAPDSGRIAVSGHPPRPGPETGFVFQSFRLIPWATVSANIEFALLPTGLGRAERRERARRYMDLVGLTRFADSYPGELSGGMGQRVALARALIPEPKILLMDEPFAALDAQTRELMQTELMRLWSRLGSVVLFVTHSVDEAIALSDKIVLMGPRPGRILEVIDVGLPRPRQLFEMRSEPRFIELRDYLWNRIRTLVLTDPASDFYGRDLEPE
ncbi:ABC transporter ATP-binding protein [Pelagibacterium lacus]|uniref:ABC transporter ATP-binding protein n=1 Tax=Pelagibacterium lacus TaxID=2282655 RepID=A0A369WCU1_9HYPH|nr:ABC transporter ATP-binding protein [Pelagibacterium lacus]RDE09921.1 ABC transporter ATP-binding protein [Pelagibacterium lacus]